MRVAGVRYWLQFPPKESHDPQPRSAGRVPAKFHLFVDRRAVDDARMRRPNYQSGWAWRRRVVHPFVGRVPHRLRACLGNARRPAGFLAQRQSARQVRRGAPRSHGAASVHRRGSPRSGPVRAPALAGLKDRKFNAPTGDIAARFAACQQELRPETPFTYAELSSGG